MKPVVSDIRQTLEYGSSHVIPRAPAIFSLIGLLMGVPLLLLGGTSGMIGAAIMLLAAVILAAMFYRLSRPNTPAIVLSPNGLVFRDVSQRPIPWTEILKVERDEVREMSAVFTRKVVSVAVSEAFFRTLTPHTAFPPEVVSFGSPTLIYLAYYHRDVPVDELADAIELRRRQGDRKAG